ncbi:MAG: integrase arm-type DNA-binding domain-containing protein [Xanthobacteraceae bacterium]
MFLSALAIQNARPRQKPYKLADGDGLHLLVQPNGKKLWRLRYRFAGKENMLVLGPLAAVSLASARSKREAARKLLAEGVDPSHQRKHDKRTAAIAARSTFAAIVEEHLKTLENSGASPATIIKNRWLLQKLAALLARRPIAQITPAEILVILKRIELSGRRETARRLRGALGTVFRLAIATLRATNDPTFALRGALAPPLIVHRPAITDETQLGALMLSIDEHDGWPTVRAALQLVALTMTRPGEVRHMQRSEIIWTKAMWRIPAERMKMRQPHDVPLSRQALAVLRDVWRLSDDDGLVLPSVRSAIKPLSNNAMNSALRRMGYAKDEMCPHGFRSAASTILNERRYDRDVIEAALAHQDENDVRAAYNRAKYWPQRVKLMQDWADLLDEFRRLPRKNYASAP